MMEWKPKYGGFILVDKEDKIYAYLGNNNKTWFLSFEQEDWPIEASSMDEAIWRATIFIYDRCNKIANHYHKIRDHLPNFRELAEKVFKDEMD